MCAGVLPTSCCRYVPVTSSRRWIPRIRIAESLFCRVVDPRRKELIYERASSLSHLWKFMEGRNIFIRPILTYTSLNLSVRFYLLFLPFKQYYNRPNKKRLNKLFFYILFFFNFDCSVNLNKTENNVYLVRTTRKRPIDGDAEDKAKCS